MTYHDDGFWSSEALHLLIAGSITETEKLTIKHHKILLKKNSVINLHKGLSLLLTMVEYGVV